MSSHWVDWHAPYADPGSPLSQRLRLVQSRLTAALDAAPAGPLRLLSACAGQGHDVLGVLPGHPRRRDVTGLLVELDPTNVALARQAIADAGLDADVHIVEADAGDTNVYADAVPADIALFCGVFGNVTDADVARTIATLPSLCAAGATVLWTRHRREPDLTARIGDWFDKAGFIEVGHDTVTGSEASVGVHRLVADPAPYRSGVRMFSFTAAGG